MTKMMAVLIFTSCVCSILVLGGVSRAGELPGINDYRSDFSIELIPSNPQPGEEVSAKIVSYQFDVDRSEISWTLDGQTIANGVGEKAINFTLSDLGRETVLTVDIVTNNGASVSKTRKFSGSDLDFLWEADTSTPAGYKGKALAGHKAVVKITVLPNLYSANKLISRSNLIYDWTLNYKNMPNASGVNKNTLSVRLNDLGDYVVGVKVSTADKRISAQKFLHLSADGISPKIVFYQDSPLEGPFYSKALSSKIFLKDNNLSLRAEPFFFNNDIGKTDYRWRMNGQSIKSGRKPNLISFRNDRNSGQTEIRLKIEKEWTNNSQTAEQGINVAF